MKTKEEYNEYMRQYMLTRYYQRRDEAIAYLGGECVDCGSYENLEFDHELRDEKSFDIGKAFTSMSHGALYEEIDKCVLRCGPCHRRKTSREDPRVVEHGGGVSGKKNCYCELCAPLKRAYAKSFRERSRGL